MTEASVSLAAEAVKGAGWTWFATLLTMAMQLVYTAVMSRTLEPQAFGLVAGAMIGLRFVSFFARFGVGNAIVQRESLEPEDIRVAITLSALLGGLMTLVSVASSPVIAAILSQPESATVMRWLALGLTIAGFSSVPEALLRRQMRFKAHSVSSATSFAFGYLVVGIGGALSGWGVWSLVAASLAQPMLFWLLTLVLVRPPTRPLLERARVRWILRFGGAVSLTGFLEAMGSALDTLAVGRWLGAASLGQYTRGTFMVQLPVEQLSTAASRVLLPGLSQVQSHKERFERGVVSSLGVLACVVVIPVAVLSVSAPAVVPLVLGTGWDVAASVLPIVGVALGVALLTTIPGVAAEARGLVGLKLAVQATSVGFAVLSIAVVVFTGPTIQRFGVAWLCTELFRHALYCFVVMPRLGLSMHAVVTRYLGAALLAVAAASPFFVAVWVLDGRGFLPLALAGLSAGAPLYLAWRLPVLAAVRADVAKLELKAIIRTIPGRAKTRLSPD